MDNSRWLDSKTRVQMHPEYKAIFDGGMWTPLRKRGTLELWYVHKLRTALPAEYLARVLKGMNSSLEFLPIIGAYKDKWFCNSGDYFVTLVHKNGRIESTGYQSQVIPRSYKLF
jgi:hypothetical protein